MEIGPQAKGESPFTAKYRKMQSEYRANVLRVPFGKGPKKNSDTYYGNMLVNGDKTGLNFISDAAFKFAKQKVLDKQIIDVSSPLSIFKDQFNFKGNLSWNADFDQAESRPNDAHKFNVMTKFSISDFKFSVSGLFVLKK